MAKFKGEAEITMSVNFTFEVDDEDVENDELVNECAEDAANDRVWGCDGNVRQIDVTLVEKVS